MKTTSNTKVKDAIIVRVCFALGILIGYPGFVFAQNGFTRGDTLTSKRGTKILIKDEKSYQMKMILQAKFLSDELGSGDITRASWGLEGDYFLPKLLSVHADMVRSYFSTKMTDATMLNEGKNKVSNFSEFEIGGRFHLIDKKALKRAKTKLSHHGSTMDHYYAGNAIPENYLISKLPARRILAVRGGIYRATTIAVADMNSSELKVGDKGAVKTADGTILAGDFYTNAHTTGVYVGLSEIYNMWVRLSPLNAEEFSNRTYRNGMFREVFLDVLFAGTSFDPFSTATGSHSIEANKTGSFQTSPIGARLGKKFAINRKTVNIGGSFEIGDRPGLIGKGYYFSCGLTVAFVK